MDKKLRPKRASSKSIQATPGQTVATDSRPIGTGSGRFGTWVDEYGRTCYGDSCVQLAVDETRHEVVVNVKPDAVCDVKPIIDALVKTLGAGARTVYEVQSELKQS